MKICKVFVIPAALLMSALLPNLVPFEQGITSYNVAADTVSNLIMKDNYHGCKESRHPYQGGDKDVRNGNISGTSNHSGKKTAYKIWPPEWKIKTVDDAKQFSDFYSRSIAVDASNHPHIAYGGDHLYYAYHDGSKWNYQTVDLSPGVGFYASIAIDTFGKVHIGYYVATQGNLKYATNASGVWVTKTVDSTGSWIAGYTSLALDSSGKPHISYNDYANGDLKYARRWLLP